MKSELESEDPESEDYRSVSVRALRRPPDAVFVYMSEVVSGVSLRGHPLTPFATRDLQGRFSGEAGLLQQTGRNNGRSCDSPSKREITSIVSMREK